MVITKKDIGNKKIYQYLLSKAKKKNPIKNIFKNKIEDTDLEKIKSLYLSKMKIYDFNFLKYLKNVDDIFLSDVILPADISILEQFSSIKNLSLSNTPIKNFNFILPNVDNFKYDFDSDSNFNDFNFNEINISKYKLMDIEALKCFPNVKFVSLIGNRIRNLSNIDKITPFIEEIDLEDNPLETIEDLCNLKNLISVDLSSCRKDEIEKLSNNPNIEYIYLSNIDDMTRTYFETVKNEKIIFD
jgi:hypothetical protein